MSSPPPVLVVRGLRKDFYRRSGVYFGKTEVIRAVDDVSFEISQGETLALVGESGCGKSTLGRLVLGLIKADRGDVILGGQDITGADRRDLRKLRRDMQIAFQDPFSSLNPRRTVYNTIAQPLRFHKVVPKVQISEEVEHLMSSVGLVPPGLFADRYPNQLSGGQGQRVGLARALAPRPKLIVADEPVASLDVSVQARVLKVMQRAGKEFGISYLFISHDLGVVRSISARVAVMYMGRIVEMGATEQVLTSPQHPYTAALLSAAPIANPKAARRRKRILLPGEITSTSVDSLPEGCWFHGRCWLYERLGRPEMCRTQQPPLQKPIGAGVPPGHVSACHYTTEIGVHLKSDFSVRDGGLDS